MTAPSVASSWAASPWFSSLVSLERSLSYHADRQNLVAGNLANLNTPGYLAKDVASPDFAALLGPLQLQVNDAAHLGAAPIAGANTITEDTATPVGADGNNVSLEKEMAKMTMSSVRYEAAAEIVSRRLALFRYAATDGQS